MTILVGQAILELQKNKNKTKQNKTKQKKKNILRILINTSRTVFSIENLI